MAHNDDGITTRFDAQIRADSVREFRDSRLSLSPSRGERMGSTMYDTRGGRPTSADELARLGEYLRACEADGIENDPVNGGAIYPSRVPSNPPARKGAAKRRGDRGKWFDHAQHGTCLGIVHPRHAESVLAKLRPLLGGADRVWCRLNGTREQAQLLALDPPADDVLAKCWQIVDSFGDVYGV